MSKTERYVVYYRMPAVGDTPNGDTLAHQRRDAVAFVDRPNGVLVGEFTEVMTPAHDSETSPAFDLSLECCRNLNAKLICALPNAALTPAAREKAARADVEILLIRGAGSPSGAGPDGQPDSETVPYLRFGNSRPRLPVPTPHRAIEPAPAGNRAKADRFAAAVLPVIDQIRKSGATTLTDIADGLNARNIRTARGRRWYPTTVKNILDRHQ